MQHMFGGNLDGQPGKVTAMQASVSSRLHRLLAGRVTEVYHVQAGAESPVSVLCFDLVYFRTVSPYLWVYEFILGEAEILNYLKLIIMNK